MSKTSFYFFKNKESGLKLYLREVRRGWGFVWLTIGTSGGSCEHGNELSGYIKCWAILE
jgi:hypothetical protein